MKKIEAYNEELKRLHVSLNKALDLEIEKTRNGTIIVGRTLSDLSGSEKILELIRATLNAIHKEEEKS